MSIGAYALHLAEKELFIAYCLHSMKDTSAQSRRDRLKVILKLLRENRVESQDELLDLLDGKGISVTQATLSRDLKLLKASKVGAGSEGYFYAVPSDDELRRREEIYAQDFLRGYVSIDWNDQMVVIKTFSGYSAPVAMAVDNIGWEGVLGTVAGQDNNVMIALRKGYSGQEFMDELKRRIPGIEED